MKDITKLYAILILILILPSCIQKYQGSLFPVKNLENKWGYIDTLGNEFIKFQYDSACSFSEGYGIVKLGQDFFYINRFGEKQFDVKLYKNAPDVLSLFPKKILLDDYNFYDGLAIFYNQEQRKFGYIDEKNKIIVNPRFKEAKRFSEGLAAVKSLSDSTKYDSFTLPKYKYGYINKEGEIVIQPQYDEAYNFGEGKAFVNFNSNDTFNKDGLMRIGWSGYYINKKGKFVSESLGFVNGYAFQGSFALMQSINHKLMSYNSYFYVDSLFNQLPKIDGKDYFFNDANRFYEGVASISNDSKWYLINEKFDLISQQEFQEISRCREGLIKVKYNGKYGFIDKTGAFTIKCKFNKCSDFNNGLAYTELEDYNVFTWGYINKEGIFVWQLTKSK